jgi:hypothetical protein
VHFEESAILGVKAELADRVVLPVERLESDEADSDNGVSRDLTVLEAVSNRVRPASWLPR